MKKFIIIFVLHYGSLYLCHAKASVWGFESFYCCYYTLQHVVDSENIFGQHIFHVQRHYLWKQAVYISIYSESSVEDASPAFFMHLQAMGHSSRGKLHTSVTLDILCHEHNANHCPTRTEAPHIWNTLHNSRNLIYLNVCRICLCTK